MVLKKINWTSMKHWLRIMLKPQPQSSWDLTNICSFCLLESENTVWDRSGNAIFIKTVNVELGFEITSTRFSIITIKCLSCRCSLMYEKLKFLFWLTKNTFTHCIFDLYHSLFSEWKQGMKTVNEIYSCSCQSPDCR